MLVPWRVPKNPQNFMPKIQSLQSRFASAARCRGLSPGSASVVQWVVSGHGESSFKRQPQTQTSRVFSALQNRKKQLGTSCCGVFFAKAILVRDTWVAHICLDGTTLSLHLESSTRFGNFEPIADGIATSWLGVSSYLGKSSLWEHARTRPNYHRFSTLWQQSQKVPV